MAFIFFAFRNIFNRVQSCVIDDSKVPLKALGLLSTISAYFAFLLAFLIVCRCFHDVFVWRNKGSNPDVLCWEAWSGRLYSS